MDQEDPLKAFIFRYGVVEDLFVEITCCRPGELAAGENIAVDFLMIGT